MIALFVILGGSRKRPKIPSVVAAAVSGRVLFAVTSQWLSRYVLMADAV